MSKKENIARNPVNGRFVTVKIGARRAAKFSAVEGLSLSSKSKKTLNNFKAKGLKGDDLREAITKQFKSK